MTNGISKIKKADIALRLAGFNFKKEDLEKIYRIMHKIDIAPTDTKIKDIVDIIDDVDEKYEK